MPVKKAVGMEVRVSDVKKWAGRQELTHLREPWPEMCHERVEFPLTAPADVEVLVRNTGRALVVEIHGKAQCEAVCSRCLEPFLLTVPFSAVEEFREEPGATDTELEYSRYTGDRIRLDELVSDAVGVSMPMVPVCRDACRGLCPQCGTNLNDAPCECVPAVDERWAVLKKFLPPQGGQ